jgi:hypothetical protein
VHHVRLDALGRLVQDQQRRVQDERPADGELLLLAAREVAAAAQRIFLSTGNSLKMRAESPAPG